MKKSTRLALSFVAGFCDTVTFVHLSGLFVAHVTGNFVVFAAAIAQGAESEAYIKLLTFPVFIVAVMLGAWVYGKPSQSQQPHRYIRLLSLMTLLLIVIGMVAALLKVQQGSIHLGIIDYVLAMVLVGAMGVQNSIHYFVPGPMTTVMTGNVMQLTATFTRKLTGNTVTQHPKPETKAQPSGVNPIILISLFVLGCALAALVAGEYGMSSILVPAGIMILIVIKEKLSNGN